MHHVPSAVGRAAAMAAALLLAPVAVAAGGFALLEQGARSMGFAGAFTARPATRPPSSTTRPASRS